jgi:hypothetical protein
MAPAPNSNTTTPKTQPWKDQWLAMGIDGTNQMTVQDGTSHGFEKGEMVIMDGNLQGDDDDDDE